MDESIEDGEPRPRREIRGWRHPTRRGVQVAAGIALLAWLLGLAGVAYVRWSLGSLARHIAGP